MNEKKVRVGNEYKMRMKSTLSIVMLPAGKVRIGELEDHKRYWGEGGVGVGLGH